MSAAISFPPSPAISDADALIAGESVVQKAVSRFSSALRDDLLQEGRLGLLDAAATFCRDGGASFTTHAFNHVRSRVFRAFRKERVRGLGRVAFSEKWITLEFDGVEEGNEPADDSSLSEERLIDRHVLRAAIDELDPRDRAIIEARLRGKTLAEIGEASGYTAKRAIDALRKALGLKVARRMRGRAA